MVRISLVRFSPLRVLGGLVLGLVSTALVVGATKGHVGWAWAALPIVGLLAIMGYRRYIEIDQGTRQIAQRVGVLLFTFRASQFDLDLVSRVVLREEKRVTRTRRGTTRTTTMYVLRVSGSAKGRLCELGDVWRARLVAERICRELGVDMENRLHGGSSTRKAVDLDLPLAERWRLAGVHPEAPKLPADSPLIIEHGESFSEFSAPVEPFPRAIAALVMLAILGGLLAMTLLGDNGFVISLVSGPIALFFGVGLIAQHTGRNCIRFTPEWVEFRRGAIVRQRRPLAHIEELLSNDHQLVLMSDSDYLVIDKPKDPAHAQLQRQFVERQIAQRQTNALIPSR